MTDIAFIYIRYRLFYPRLLICSDRTSRNAKRSRQAELPFVLPWRVYENKGQNKYENDGTDKDENVGYSKSNSNSNDSYDIRNNGNNGNNAKSVNTDYSIFPESLDSVELASGPPVQHVSTCNTNEALTNGCADDGIEVVTDSCIQNNGAIKHDNTTNSSYVNGDISVRNSGDFDRSRIIEIDISENSSNDDNNDSDNSGITNNNNDNNRNSDDSNNNKYDDNGNSDDITNRHNNAIKDDITIEDDDSEESVVFIKMSNVK